MSRPTQRLSASSWSTIGLMGPAANRFFLTWGSGNPPSEGGVPESTTMGPVGGAIVSQSAVREGAAFVRSITLVDGSIVARFWALITVFVPGKGNCVLLALSEGGCLLPHQPSQVHQLDLEDGGPRWEHSGISETWNS